MVGGVIKILELVILRVLCLFFSVCCGGAALVFQEEFGKMALAEVSAGGGDFLDGQAGGEEEFFSAAEAQLGDVIIVADSQGTL